MSARHTLATLYGVGLCGFAPGTAGSAVAAVLAYGMLQLPFGWALLPVGVMVFTILGTTSATRYMRVNQCEHDPGEIIVDELAGQWLTYSVAHLVLVAMWGVGMQVPVASLTALLNSVALNPMPMDMVAGFFLFRAFDIVKPWPISWADKNIHGGWGVMFDDLLAAVPAGVFLAAWVLFAPLLRLQLPWLP